jgi:hypothetical protein
MDCLYLFFFSITSRLSSVTLHSSFFFTGIVQQLQRDQVCLTMTKLGYKWQKARKGTKKNPNTQARTYFISKKIQKW